jgi:hypothetical protein
MLAKSREWYLLARRGFFISHGPLFALRFFAPKRKGGAPWWAKKIFLIQSRSAKHYSFVYALLRKGSWSESACFWRNMLHVIVSSCLPIGNASRLEELSATDAVSPAGHFVADGNEVS